MSLQFRAVQDIDWYIQSTPLRRHVDGKNLVRHESLLTLAYYLDWAQMLQQCEAVLLTVSRFKKLSWMLSQSWYWLEHSTHYKLDKVRAFCIATIAADSGMLDREEYKGASCGGIKHWAWRYWRLR